jgi:hypothetical protein
MMSVCPEAFAALNNATVNRIPGNERLRSVTFGNIRKIAVVVMLAQVYRHAHH